MRERIFGLDVMRAAAILFVMMAHTYEFLWPSIEINLHRLFGFIGVELFFVLSGFLIGGILLRILDKEGGLSWPSLKRFWIRRWFRTLPNYYLCLLLYIIFHWISGVPSDLTPTIFFQFIFFLQNSLSPHPGFYAIAWSLSIEEWFYFLFPLVLIMAGILTKGWQRQTLITVLTFVVLCLAMRWTLADISDLSWGAWYRKMTFWRLDSIAIGVLFAWFQKSRSTSFNAFRIPMAAIGLLLVIFLFVPFWKIYVTDGHNNTFLSTIFFTLFSLAMALWIPLLNSWRRSRGWMARSITLISKISYSLYLIHWMVVLAFAVWLDIPEDWIKFTGIWSVSLLLSWIMYQYYETRMTALRERF